MNDVSVASSKVTWVVGNNGNIEYPTIEMKASYGTGHLRFEGGFYQTDPEGCQTALRQLSKMPELLLLMKKIIRRVPWMELESSVQDLGSKAAEFVKNLEDNQVEVHNLYGISLVPMKNGDDVDEVVRVAKLMADTEIVFIVLGAWNYAIDELILIKRFLVAKKVEYLVYHADQEGKISLDEVYAPSYFSKIGAVTELANNAKRIFAAALINHLGGTEEEVQAAKAPTKSYYRHKGMVEVMKQNYGGVE